jgi:hypothetical protein
MRLWLLVVFISLLATGAPGAGELASVRIVVSDNFGNRITGVDIKLAREGKSLTVRDDTPVSLAYGEYAVSVRVPGAGLTDYIVKVDQPRQVIAVAMKLGAMEGPRPVCSLSGNVISDHAVSRLRLIAPYGIYMVDVGVSDAGAYSFTNLECGDYIVMAFGSKECIGARRIRIAGGQSLADLRFNAPAGPDGCPLPK